MDRRTVILAIVPALACALPVTAGMVSAHQTTPAELVSIVVVLREPASLRSIDGDDTAYARENRSLQKAVIMSVFGKTPRALVAAGRGLSQFDFIPSFAILATPAEISKLHADKRVKSISKSRLFRPLSAN